MAVKAMSALRQPFFHFLRNHRFEEIVAILLVVNASFLYVIWKKKDNQFSPITHFHSADSNYASLKKEIQQVFHKAMDEGFRKDTLVVEVYLTDRQCPTCIDEALPYWMALDGNAKLIIHFLSRSTSSRQAERFS